MVTRLAGSDSVMVRSVSAHWSGTSEQGVVDEVLGDVADNVTGDLTESPTDTREEGPRALRPAFGVAVLVAGVGHALLTVHRTIESCPVAGFEQAKHLASLMGSWYGPGSSPGLVCPRAPMSYACGYPGQRSCQRCVTQASAERLSQCDDDALGAAEVAESIHVLVLHHLANEFRAVGLQAGEDVVDVRRRRT